MVINTNNDLTTKTNSHSSHKMTNNLASSDKQSDKQSTSPSRDQVELSQEARTIKHLESKVQASEGVDSTKVEEIRQRIANGDYTIDNQRLANNILLSDL